MSNPKAESKGRTQSKPRPKKPSAALLKKKGSEPDESLISSAVELASHKAKPLSGKQVLRSPQTMDRDPSHAHGSRVTAQVHRSMAPSTLSHAPASPVAARVEAESVGSEDPPGARNGSAVVFEPAITEEPSTILSSIFPQGSEHEKMARIVARLTQAGGMDKMLRLMDSQESESAHLPPAEPSRPPHSLEDDCLSVTPSAGYGEFLEEDEDPEEEELEEEGLIYQDPFLPSSYSLPGPFPGQLQPAGYEWPPPHAAPFPGYSGIHRTGAAFPSVVSRQAERPSTLPIPPAPMAAPSYMVPQGPFRPPVDPFQGVHMGPAATVGPGWVGPGMDYPMAYPQPPQAPSLVPGDVPKVLSPQNSRDFWAKVLRDSGFPVEYPPQEEPSDSLGVAGRADYSRPTVSVPFIPIAEQTRRAIRDSHESRQMSRMFWLAKALPARQVDDDIVSTPLCPADCFARMGEDRNSRCNPLPPTPQGVQSSGQPRRPVAPFTVGSWNKARDAELRALESLARDGLRASNAHLLAFAHLANSLLPSSEGTPPTPLSPDHLRRTVEVLRDLTHVGIDHSIRIVEQSIAFRRLIAVQAVNLADRSALLAAPLGTDLFGGKWPETVAVEETRRKRKAEQAQLQPRGAKRPRARGGSATRGQRPRQPGSTYQQAFQQPLLQQQLSSQQQPLPQQGWNQQQPFHAQGAPQPLMQPAYWEPPSFQPPSGKKSNRRKAKAGRGGGRGSRGGQRGRRGWGGRGSGFSGAGYAPQC